MSYGVSITQDGTVLQTAGKYLGQDIVVGMSDSIKLPAQTYNPSTTDQVIPAGKFLAGAQTFKACAGTKQITENGTVDVAGFASAQVNVPIPQGYKDMGSWDLIANSVDEDGNPYNGGLGYKEGYRLNSSGEEVEDASSFCTGFIPVAGFIAVSAYIETTTSSVNAAIVQYLRRYDSLGTVGYSFSGFYNVIGITSRGYPSTKYIRASFNRGNSSISPKDSGARIKIIR